MVMALGETFGAKYSPGEPVLHCGVGAGQMKPTVALPPGIVFTIHTTDVSFVPDTMSVN